MAIERKYIDDGHFVKKKKTKECKDENMIDNLSQQDYVLRVLHSQNKRGKI